MNFGYNHYEKQKWTLKIKTSSGDFYIYIYLGEKRNYISLMQGVEDARQSS